MQLKMGMHCTILHPLLLRCGVECREVANKKYFFHFTSVHFISFACRCHLFGHCVCTMHLTVLEITGNLCLLWNIVDYLEKRKVNIASILISYALKNWCNGFFIAFHAVLLKLCKFYLTFL